MSFVVVVFIVGFVWLVIDNKLLVKELWMLWVVFGLMLYVGLLMVLNVLFYSGKVFDVCYCVLFGVMVFVFVLFVVILSDLLVVLFGLFVGYVVLGYLLWGWCVLYG